jgi:hypothetical protein
VVSTKAQLPRKLRAHLNGCALISSLREKFSEIKDSRQFPEYPLEDVLSTGLATFKLKKPNLSHLDHMREEIDTIYMNNMNKVFKVRKIISDTQCRAVLDPIDFRLLLPCFKKIFSVVQRGKLHEEFKSNDGYQLVAIDGTQYFASKELHCDNCQEKHHENGNVTYSHSMLTAVMISPDKKQVIPMMVEPIIKQDGTTKNDCEGNAGERMLYSLKNNYPKLKIRIIEDGLYSKAPHIRLLKELDFSFIIGAKEGDHKYLYNLVKQLKTQEGFDAFKEEDPQGFSSIVNGGGGKVSEYIIEEPLKKGKIKHKFCYVNSVPLNASNKDLLVNFLQYREETENEKGEVIKVQSFTWVADVELTNENVYELMREGRARWRIENETFNTLKNQNYNFEHNYGHGKQNLSVNMAILMMLSFLTDQVEEATCWLFQKAHARSKTRIKLWERMRGAFEWLMLDSWTHILCLIAKVDYG